MAAFSGLEEGGFDPFFGTPYDPGFTARPMWEAPLSGFQSPYREAIEEKKKELRERASFTEILSGSADLMQQLGYTGAEWAGEIGGLEGLTEWGRAGRKAEARELDPLYERMEPFPGIGAFFQPDEGQAGKAKQWFGEQMVLQAPLMAPVAAAAFAAPFVGVPAALGGAAAAIPMGIAETQLSAKEKAEAAGTETDPLTVGAFGTFSGLLDTIVPGRMGSMLFKKFGPETAERIATSALQKAGERGFLGSLRRGVKEGGKSGATEAVTEIVQETVAQEIGGSIAAGTPIEWERLPETAFQAGILGGGMGAGVGGVVGAMPGRKRAFEDGGLTVDTEAIAGRGPIGGAGGAAAPGSPAGLLSEIRALTGPRTPPSEPPGGGGGGGPLDGGTGFGPFRGAPGETFEVRGKTYQYDAEGKPQQVFYGGQFAEPEPSAAQRPTTDLDAIRTMLARTQVAAARARVEPPKSDEQADAGNYKKGPVKDYAGLGLDLTIETPKGAERSGIAADGQRWAVQMPADYGYVRRTEGADGEQVDVYLGEEHAAPEAYVIDQVDADTKKFDEHKVMLGFPSQEAALATYEQAFSDGRGKDRVGGVKAVPIAELKDWLSSPQRKPAMPKAGMKRPVMAMLKKAGGVDPRSSLAGDLRAMGINPRSSPGLFKAGGMGAVDNFVAAEHPLFADKGDERGYIPPEAITEALQAEFSGQPLRTAEEAATEAEVFDEDRIRDHIGTLVEHARTTGRGFRIRKDERRRAAQLVSQGLDPDEVFERLAIDDVVEHDRDVAEEEGLYALERRTAREDRDKAEKEGGEAGREAGREAAPAPVGREVREPQREGEQGVIPGAERISDKELAQRKADEKLKPKKPQEGKESLGGLFGDAPKQGSLFERRKKTEAQVAKIINKAIEHFGITDNPLEAGYILADGRMLDFSGRHQQQDSYRREGDRWVPKRGTDYQAGQRAVDHREIYDVTGRGGTEGMYDFMRDTGALRYQPRLGGAFFGSLSDAQIRALLRAHRQTGGGDPLLLDIYEDQLRSKEFARPTLEVIKAWIEEGAAEEKVKAKPGANLGRVTKMLGTSLYGTPGDLPKVAVKELLQNSFDALKAAIEKGQIKAGQIDIHVDYDNRKVWLVDNGTGMTPEVLGKEFLEIAGTVKETERASGGFGIAKMLFLFENKAIRVRTLRNGVLAELNTTGEDLKAAIGEGGAAPDVEITRGVSDFGGVVRRAVNDAFEGPRPASWRAPAPETFEGAKHGTIVEIDIPESYVDPSNGETRDIGFPYAVNDVPVVTHSLMFAPITVRYNGTPLPIGANLNKEDYTPFVDVKFEWGRAKIYIGKPNSYNWQDHLHIMSNGLWQFSQRLPKDPLEVWGDQVEDDVYLDIEPAVAPEDIGYPFDLNRQGFKKQAQDDLAAILNYLSLTYQKESSGKDALRFGDAHYVDGSGNLTRADITPVKPVQASVPRIKKGDKIEIKEGRLIVNGKEVPVLTPDEMKNFKVDWGELKVAEGTVDPKRVMIHDNAVVKVEGSTLQKALAKVKQVTRDLFEPADPNATEDKVEVAVGELARARFGKRFDQFMFQIGRQFMQLRDVVADELSYPALKEEAVGISFDPQYRGVSIRVPFSGSFVNPGATEYADLERAAFGVIGTMIHELAHHQVRSHNADFPAEMQRIMIALKTTKKLDYPAWEKRVVDLFKQNDDIFQYLHKVFTNESVRSSGRSFKDRGTVEAEDAGAPGAVGSARQGAKRGAGVPEGGGPAARGARQVEDREGLSQGDLTSTPAFKRWFGDSKVVDAEGRPLVVYHSTAKDFDAFDTKRSELGSHFGPVDQTRDLHEGVSGAKMVPVFLSIKNPLRLDDHGDFDPATVEGQLIAEGILPERDGYWEKPMPQARLQAAIKRAGYDGVVYLNRREGSHFTMDEDMGEYLPGVMSDEVFLEYFPQAQDSWIALDPEQIKSATGNRGTFDPDDPNILMDRVPIPQALKDRANAMRRAGASNLEIRLATGLRWTWGATSEGWQRYAPGQDAPAKHRISEDLKVQAERLRSEGATPGQIRRETGLHLVDGAWKRSPVRRDAPVRAEYRRRSPKVDGYRHDVGRAIDGAKGVTLRNDGVGTISLDVPPFKEGRRRGGKHRRESGLAHVLNKRGRDFAEAVIPEVVARGKAGEPYMVGEQRRQNITLGRYEVVVQHTIDGKPSKPWLLTAFEKPTGVRTVPLPDGGVGIPKPGSRDLYAFEPVHGLYSPLQKGLENLEMKKGNPDQWLNRIKQLPNVRQSQLDWVGVEAWLEQRKGLNISPKTHEIRQRVSEDMMPTKAWKVVQKSHDEYTGQRYVEVYDETGAWRRTRTATRATDEEILQEIEAEEFRNIFGIYRKGQNSDEPVLELETKEAAEQALQGNVTKDELLGFVQSNDIKLTELFRSENSQLAAVPAVGLVIPPKPTLEDIPLDVDEAELQRLREANEEEGDEEQEEPEWVIDYHRVQEEFAPSLDWNNAEMDEPDDDYLRERAIERLNDDEREVERLIEGEFSVSVTIDEIGYQPGRRYSPDPSAANADWKWDEDTEYDGEEYKEGGSVPPAIRQEFWDKVVDLAFENEREWYFDDQDSPQTVPISLGDSNISVPSANYSYGEWYWNGENYNSEERMLAAVWEEYQDRITDDLPDEYWIDEETGETKENWQPTNEADRLLREAESTRERVLAERLREWNRLYGSGGTPSPNMGWKRYSEEGGEDYFELHLMIEPKPGQEFTEGHFSSQAPNGVVWVRGKRRQDDQGRDIGFIEEVQSDWASYGRKRGFRRQLTAEEREQEEADKEASRKASREEADALDAFGRLTDKEADRLLDLVTPEVYQRVTGFTDAGELTQYDKDRIWRGIKTFLNEYTSDGLGSLSKWGEWALPLADPKVIENLKKAAATFKEAVARRQEADERVAEWRLIQSGVPDMPYKEDYHAPVIKRMLRFAVDHGWAGIAWTPASMQIDRWNDGLRANIANFTWRQEKLGGALEVQHIGVGNLISMAREARAAGRNDEANLFDNMADAMTRRGAARLSEMNVTDQFYELAAKALYPLGAPERVETGNITVRAKRKDSASTIEIVVDPNKEIEVDKIDKKGRKTGEKIKIKPGIVVEGHGGIQGKTLAEVVGGPIAKRILANASGMKLNEGGVQVQEVIEGEELSVGGRGFHVVYNERLVSQLDKFGKAFGAKVDRALLPDFMEETVPRPGVTGADMREAFKRAHDILTAEHPDNFIADELAAIDDYSGTASADELLRAFRNRVTNDNLKAIVQRGGKWAKPIADLLEQGGKKVPIIYITPEMAESVLQGQPFAIAGRRHRLTPKAANEWGKIAAEVRKVLDTLAPNVKHQFLKRMRAHGRDVAGKFAAEVETIMVALSASDPVGVARHEVIHALRQLGFISPKEWETLAHEAIRGNWREKYEIDQNYGEIYNSRFGPEEASERLLEEAIAHHFAEWRAGGKAPSVIVAIYRAIRDFARRLRNALQGLGFQTFEDVFERIEVGEVGMRNRQKTWMPIEQGGELYAFDQLRREALEGYKSLDWDWQNALMQGNFGRAAGQFWYRLRYLQQDVFLPVKLAIQRAQAAGANVVDDLDPYLKEEMYHKRVAEKLERITERYLDPILKLMADNGITEEMADLYLYARHAEERNEHIATVNAAFPDAGSGMTTREARAILQTGFTPEQRGVLNQIGTLIDEMHAWKLDFLVEEGVIHRTTAASLRGRFKHYVPLKGLDVPEGLWAAPKGMGPSFNVKGSVFKAALGRRELAKGLLANAITDMKDAAVRAEKNRVMRAFYDFTRAFPQPELYEADAMKFKRILVKRRGLYQGQTLSVPAHLSAAPDIERYIRDPLGEMGRGYVHLMVNGERKVVKINNPALQDSLEKTRQGIEGWGLISSANRLLARVLISWNPAFFVPNFVRDVSAAGLRTYAQDGGQAARTIMKDAFKAMRGIAAVEFGRGNQNSEWARLYREVAEVGGLTGFSDLVRDPVAMQARISRKLRLMQGEGWQRPSEMVEALDKFFEPFNSIFENASRVAAYKWGLDNGMTKEQAASLAKNITLNFNRKGANQTLRTLFLFANPAVQGMTVFLRAATSRNGAKMLGGMFLAGAANAIINTVLGAAMADDDDENAYTRIGEWQRNNNIIIMNPYYLFSPAEKGVDKRTWDHFTIPLPYVFSLPYQLGRRAAETVMARTTDEYLKPPTAAETALGVVSDTISAFSPVGTHPNPAVWATPSIAKPFIELYTNETFTGREIAPSWAANDPGPQFAKHQRHTGVLAVEISRWLNSLSGGDSFMPGWIDIPPDNLEHLFNAYSGEWGRLTMKGYDLATTSMRVATGEWRPEDVELKGQDVPVLRRFWQSDTGSAYTAEYYDIRNTMLNVKTAKGIKGRDEEAKAFLAKWPVHTKLLPKFERSEKDLRDLNKKIKTIQDSETMTEAQKDLKIRDIYDLKQVSYRRFLMDYYAQTRLDAIERSDASPADKEKMREMVMVRRNTGMTNLGLIEREIKGIQAPQGRPPEGADESYNRLMERYRRTVLPALRNY